MKESIKILSVAVLFSLITACGGGGGGNNSNNENPDVSQPSVILESDISKAKGLIKNSRTLVKQVGDNFESPIDALDADQQTIESVYNSNVVDVADLLGQIVDQTIEYFDRTTSLQEQLDNPGTHDIPIVNDLGINIGTLNAVVSINDGLTIILNGSATGATGITANVTDLRITSNLNRSDIEVIQPGTSQSGWTAAFTSDDVKLGISGFIGNEMASLALEDVSLQITASEPVTVRFKGNQNILPRLTSASFNGTVVIKADDATFAGTTEIKLVSLDAAKRTTPDISLSIKYLAVSGEFASPRGTFSASVTLDIENAATFDTFGFMDNRRYTRDSVQYNGFEEIPFFSEKIQDCLAAIGEGYSNSDLDYFSIRGTRTSMQIYCEIYSNSLGKSESASLNGINVPAGVVNELTDILSSNHNLTEKNIQGLVSLNFYYYSFPAYGDGYGYLNYEIDNGEFETVDNFVRGMLSVTASATVPGIPSVVATLTVKREELDGGNASLTVSHDDQTYKISIRSNNVSDAANSDFTITLSNPDGVQVTFTSDGNGYVGSISVDGKNVGTVETAQDLPVVRYNDGTMETLF